MMEKINERKRTEIIELEAEIQRCETIVETIRSLNLEAGEKEPEAEIEKRPETVEEAEEKALEVAGAATTGGNDDNHPTIRPEKPSATADLRQTLIGSMTEEPILSQYLRAAKNEPILALAQAKGDIAYYNKSKSSDNSRFSERSFLGKLWLPGMLILITAVAGNFVGMWLQKLSFERNKQFEVKLERLREAERTASNLIVSLRDLSNRAALATDNQSLTWEPKNILLSYKGDLERILELTAASKDQEIITKDVELADSHLNGYFECLEKPPVTPDANCSTNFKLDSFKTLRNRVSSALINFIEE